MSLVRPVDESDKTWLESLTGRLVSTEEIFMTEPLQRVVVAYTAHKRSRESEELSSALAVGRALLELKAACPYGAYQAAVRQAGIPYSTAALFARLARHEPAIVAVGAASIREARAALTASSAPAASEPPADGSSVLALAKALGKSIAEAAEVEALVHGTDAESVVERYTSEAVAVSVATALAR
jgi:hypothetical protein